MAGMVKVSQGQKFKPKAADWNAMIDAAQYVKNRAVNQEGRPGQDDPTTTLVRNLSQFDVPQFGLVWIVAAPWRGLVTVDRPAHPFISSLAIAAVPIPKKGVGRVWMDGLRPLRVVGWDKLDAESFPFMAISQMDSFDAKAWTGTGTIPVWARLDTSPLVLADLTGRRI